MEFDHQSRWFFVHNSDHVQWFSLCTKIQVRKKWWRHVTSFDGHVTKTLAASFVTFLVFSPKFGKVAGTYDLLFFMDTGRSEVVGTLIPNLLQSNSFELFALNGGGGCKYILYSSLFRGICLFTGAGRGKGSSMVPCRFQLFAQLIHLFNQLWKRKKQDSVTLKLIKIIH